MVTGAIVFGVYRLKKTYNFEATDNVSARGTKRIVIRKRVIAARNRSAYGAQCCLQLSRMGWEDSGKFLKYC